MPPARSPARGRAQLSYLVEHHECKDKAVRFRATQMIGLIMSSFGEEDELSEELFDALQAALLARCQDKIPLVRLHAINALQRLQMPSDKEDPVTRELIRLMTTDTSADVRLAALRSIGLAPETLPHILRRARDVKPEVRRAAYEVIGSKITAKWLSIAQRVELLRDGLRERDESVRTACVAMLRTHWLRKADGRAAAVLGLLDVEAHTDVAELAARELLREAELPAALAGGAPWLDGAPLLSLEDALLLRVRYEELSTGSAAARAELDGCAPDIPAFVAVLRAHGGQPAVLRELLRLALVLDLTDEAGRRMLGAYAAELLSSVELVSRPGGAPLTAAALALLRATQDSELALVRVVAELISELHDPLDGSADDDAAGGGGERAPGAGDEGDAGSEAEAARFQAEAELADALARAGELKSQLASCVALEDFDAAAMIKRDIRELEEHVAALEAAGTPARPAAEANVHSLCALRLTASLLSTTTCDARAPEVAGLCAAIILPAMQNAAEPVRELATTCLGLSCALGAAFGARYWRLLVQVAARDSAPAVRAAALRALADVACTWSAAQLSAAAEGGAPGADGEEAAAECARALCRAAVRDGGSAEPQAQAAGAQGLCKLLLLGRVDDGLRLPCLASALCALFAADGSQPASAAGSGGGSAGDEAEAERAHTLGAMRQFVQLFFHSFHAKEQRKAVALALVPLARASAAAPRRTAWADVDVERAAQFVCFCAGEPACALLCREIGRELLAHPDAPYAAALTKGLCALAPSAAALAAAAGAADGDDDADKHGAAEGALLRVRARPPRRTRCRPQSARALAGRGSLRACCTANARCSLTPCRSHLALRALCATRHSLLSLWPSLSSHGRRPCAPQETFALLRSLVGPDSPLDKATARAVSKWLGAHDGAAAGDEDDEDEGEAVALPEEVARAAAEASRAQDEMLNALIALCSSIPRGAVQDAEQQGSADGARAGRPTRKLTKKAGRAV